MIKEVHTIEMQYDFAPGTVNMFLYRSGNSFTLIDAGEHSEAGFQQLLHVLAERDYRLSQIDRIVLTHHHWDHIGFVNRILKNRDIPVYVHPEGIPRLIGDVNNHNRRINFFEKMYAEAGCGETGKKYMESVRKKWLVNEKRGYPIRSELVPLQENEPIEGAEDLKVFEMPGHSFDHLIFYDEKEKWLFAGDHLLEHISSNAIVEPDSDGNRIQTWNDYRASLQRTALLDVSVVYSGHGQAFSGHKALIEKRLIRMGEKGERVAALLAEQELTPFEIAQRIYAKVLQDQFFLVMSEVIGLLDLLESEGKVEKRLNDGVWVYRNIFCK